MTRTLVTRRKTYQQNNRSVLVKYNDSDAGFSELTDEDMKEIEMMACKDTRQGRRARVIYYTSYIGDNL
jgi:hypothetical protein